MLFPCARDRGLSRLLCVMTPLTVRVGAERLMAARAADPASPLTAPRGVESRRPLAIEAPRPVVHGLAVGDEVTERR